MGKSQVDNFFLISIVFLNGGSLDPWIPMGHDLDDNWGYPHPLGNLRVIKSPTAAKKSLGNLLGNLSPSPSQRLQNQ
jgi:hypothetical protein